MDFPRPNFRGAFLGGYNKSDVEDYLMDVQEQLDRMNARQEAKDKQLQQLKESSGNMDSSTIQEALLNAQRMSKMVIDEANQMAEQIRAQAQEDLNAKKKAGEEVTGRGRSPDFRSREPQKRAAAGI